MTKKHNNYWQKRSNDIMRYVDSTDVDMFAELQKVYVEQSAELQRDLFAFVTKYADDNKMSYSDALQRLRGVDLSDYQANAKKYREQAENDPELLKRLNEQYVSSKVTRFDALNLEMIYKIGVMQGIIEKSFENYLKSTAKYAYRKAMGDNSGALNEPALKELINTPFNGQNYSQQVWGNTDDLARDLRDVLKRGFIRGDDVRRMAGELAKKYNVARSRAQTLIRTDGTAIVNRSAIKRYEESGLEFYRISVQMDNRTSQICKNIHSEDKRYRIDEFSTGVTAPPFHYNCRSAVIPDEEELDEKSFKNIEKANVDNLFEDVSKIWDEISQGVVDRDQIRNRLQDRYDIGILSPKISQYTAFNNVYIDANSLSSSLKSHGQQYTLDEFKLIEDVIKKPYLALDNSSRVEGSLLLYAKIPNKDRLVMEAVIIPRDAMMMIHFNKVGIRQEKKNRKNNEILYEKSKE
ncbi:minor capsid protein [Streptococcus gallolyticus]|jgi:SPP1 gp7 family putative phage head morphogenesis protein|uniref:minor capsid protein n=1 Tax=Streptococcus gallolyticus TaxID=315405 RepID=UPI000E412E9E|nr:minor capsid protein [Streptococcus gallolyticus]RGC38408.1 phage head morphogenesis protein [Streptococcus gallolyticus]